MPLETMSSRQFTVEVETPEGVVEAEVENKKGQYRHTLDPPEGWTDEATIINNDGLRIKISCSNEEAHVGKHTVNIKNLRSNLGRKQKGGESKTIRIAGFSFIITP